jgi:hypothetical protein
VERFESRVLPLFKRRTREVGELLPQLYLHGLAQGDFELALRGLLGEGAPLSASSIERLRGQWVAQYEAWRTRSLIGLEPVYLWADGIYVKGGLRQLLGGRYLGAQRRCRAAGTEDPEDPPAGASADPRSRAHRDRARLAVG